MPKILSFSLSAHRNAIVGIRAAEVPRIWIHGNLTLSKKSYRSLLVPGGLLPSGHEDMFVNPGSHEGAGQQGVVQRTGKKRISAMSPLEFSQESREAEKERLQAEEVKKTATEQLIHASGRVPKKARTRLAMMAFSGATARQDAERAEKSRWLGHLATILTGTDTPLGRRLVEKPAACNSMGLGLRSGTLRNRVHA